LFTFCAYVSQDCKSPFSRSLGRSEWPFWASSAIGNGRLGVHFEGGRKRVDGCTRESPSPTGRYHRVGERGGSHHQEGVEKKGCWRCRSTTTGARSPATIPPGLLVPARWDRNFVLARASKFQFAITPSSSSSSSSSLHSTTADGRERIKIAWRKGEGEDCVHQRGRGGGSIRVYRLSPSRTEEPQM